MQYRSELESQSIVNVVQLTNIKIGYKLIN